MDNKLPDRQCVSCSEVKAADEFAGKKDKCRDCDRAEAEYLAEINRILDEDRPKRAHASDRSWRERAYAWARNHMPNETTLHRRKAQGDVDWAEIRRTRKGNDVLRAYWTGAARLFFLEDEGRFPIKLGQDHVRIDSLTTPDSRQFAREMRADLKKVYDSGLAVADAADYLADLATEQGFMFLSQLGNLPPRGQEDAEAI